MTDIGDPAEQLNTTTIGSMGDAQRAGVEETHRVTFQGRNGRDELRARGAIAGPPFDAYEGVK